jgi:hypothetical protein
VAKRISVHLKGYKTLIYGAITEEKHHSLPEDFTRTNIFAAMTANLPL